MKTGHEALHLLLEAILDADKRGGYVSDLMKDPRYFEAVEVCYDLHEPDDPED